MSLIFPGMKHPKKIELRGNRKCAMNIHLAGPSLNRIVRSVKQTRSPGLAHRLLSTFWFVCFPDSPRAEWLNTRGSTVNCD